MATIAIPSSLIFIGVFQETPAFPVTGMGESFANLGRSIQTSQSAPITLS